jgi:hypothetical protein
MGNRLNIPVPAVLRLSDGVTQEARPAVLWYVRSKPVGGLGRKIRPGNSERRMDAESSDKADWLMLCCREKLLSK